MPEPEKKSYRLAQVHVEHFERIEVVDVAPEPDLTIISGENAQGKSSFLDFIRGLFEGKGSRPTVPIKEGHAAGGGFAVLTEDGKIAFTVELELREGKGDRLVVKDADGNPTAKGQEWLKSLIGRGLAFDPAEFDEPPGCKTREARDKARLEMLFRLHPDLAVTLADLKTKREDFYRRRTIANQDKERLTGKVAALGARRTVPETVDLAGKRAALRAAVEARTKLAAAETRIRAIDNEIAELRTRFERLKAEREQHVAIHTSAGAAPDTAALEAEIAAAERTNEEAIRAQVANQQYDETLRDLGAAKKLSDEMSAAIEAVDAQKVAALENAKFPVEGLFVSDTEVRFKGLPYEQASDAERLEIAFAVTSADKPQLALALIDVGERFGVAAVERIRGIAQRQGVQVILARRSPDIARRVELVDGRRVPVEGVAP